jgi:rRNA small subunit pseudouridine methyltransferase Nep1
MQEFRLLNSDEHANYLQRKGEDPALFRPDICHQALLAILDSPLNKSGKVKVCVHSMLHFVRSSAHATFGINDADCSDS